MYPKLSLDFLLPKIDLQANIYGVFTMYNWYFLDSQHYMHFDFLHCSRATVKTLWMKIRHDEPELMSNFEDFLYKISNDIQRARGDFESLEAALKR